MQPATLDQHAEISSPRAVRRPLAVRRRVIDRRKRAGKGSEDAMLLGDAGLLILSGVPENAVPKLHPGVSDQALELR